MVSKYLKALALTLVILAIGLYAINYLDNVRSEGIARILEENALGIQASAQLYAYESVFPEENVCGFVLSRIESQKTEAGKLLAELEASQANRLFPDSGLLKKKFLLQNIELYLLTAKAQKECPESQLVPVLYFYTENEFVADEASQAKILDSIVSECQNVRVFAFPHDEGIPVVEILVHKYGVSKSPSVVVGNELIQGIVGEVVLRQKLSC
ncbi:MAG: hypothetical protein NUV67_00220 [archaeon]|nr:hypothetical protein [archaeon]